MSDNRPPADQPDICIGGGAPPEASGTIWLRNHASSDQPEVRHAPDSERTGEEAAVMAAGGRRGIVSTKGTYSCPICGCATPHAHSQEQINEWREQEIAPELVANCSVCRGESTMLQRKAVRNSGGFYFHHALPDFYWAIHPRACEAQHIQHRLEDILRQASAPEVKE